MSKHKEYHILYVDDEEGNLRVFQAAFRKKYHIHIARSGNEALEILEQESIQLLITDQKMPKMTGVELLEKVTELYPSMMKLILTGYSDVEDIIRALNKCGIYRYLMKPWQKEEMGSTLDKALEVYQLRKDRRELLEELKANNEQLEERIMERTSELSQTNEKLKQEIEERKQIAKDLQIAKEKAEEGSKAKQLFLSTMSHEIRTPLNAVIGMAHLLEESSLNDVQRENLQVLLFSAKSLLTLINDILDFSRIEAGKLEIDPIPFDIHELLKNISNAHKPKAQKLELNYLISIDPNIPRILVGDEGRLGQILNNLLGNALKFTSSGEIQVLVRLLEETHSQKVRIQFIIKDTGIGIAKEKLDLIFEQFSQASSETTRKYGGSGLGLAIAKRLIEVQGGSIRVSSEEGKGTTFTFDLPFRIASAEEQSAIDKASFEKKQKRPVSSKLSQLNILLVEDNQINQILMKKFFSNWQTPYTLAVNGKEAIEKVQEQDFDLILMDIQMPVMDGYAATKAIRRLPESRFQEIPIIALTASTLQGEHVKVKSVGMDDYIVKPFDPQVLTQKILYHTSLGNDEAETPAVEADLDGFKDIMEGDEEGYKELIQATILDLQDLREAVTTFMKNRDAGALMIASHNMKPPLEIMKLDQISENLRQLRQVSEEDILSIASVLQQQLQSIHLQLSQEL